MSNYTPLLTWLHLLIHAHVDAKAWMRNYIPSRWTSSWKSKVELSAIWDVMTPMWCHCNALAYSTLKEIVITERDITRCEKQWGGLRNAFRLYYIRYFKGHGIREVRAIQWPNFCRYLSPIKKVIWWYKDTKRNQRKINHWGKRQFVPDKCTLWHRYTINTIWELIHCEG